MPRRRGIEPPSGNRVGANGSVWSAGRLILLASGSSLSVAIFLWLLSLFACIVATQRPLPPSFHPRPPSSHGVGALRC